MLKKARKPVHCINLISESKRAKIGMSAGQLIKIITDRKIVTETVIAPVAGVRPKITLKEAILAEMHAPGVMVT
jgi:hypothetical protein